MHVHGFHHLAIQVRDLEGVATFYKEVLGLSEQVRHHRDDGTLRAIWLSLPDGAFLALEACTGQPPKDDFRRSATGFHLLALRIRPEDRPAIERELADRGVEIVHRTRWTVYVRDPEGNRIGLSHHPHEPVE